MSFCPKCYDDLVMSYKGDKLYCKSCGYEEKIIKNNKKEKKVLK